MPASKLGARPSMATAWHCVGVAHALGALPQHVVQHHAPVVGRAADQEIPRALVPRPRPSQSMIGLEPARGQDDQRAPPQAVALARLLHARS